MFGEVPGVGDKFAALDAPDDVGQDGIGATGEPEPIARAHDEAVEEFDLGATSLQHVLTHRGALLGCGVLGVLEALLFVAVHRRRVALARPRNGLRRQVHDVLERITEGLADPNCLAAEPGREAADRLVLQHLRAG